MEFLTSDKLDLYREDAEKEKNNVDMDVA
ncbi:hypothetical protein TIFTF001_041373 [Ficus carica]|uniref:Uncharacterized protein n=1 Tax=Ficus carica TaxID=3494 RepID=A0AA88CU13_FICCA|nr:hypothetical protein TIFTF001_041373 [Ficus carica]